MLKLRGNTVNGTNVSPREKNSCPKGQARTGSRRKSVKNLIVNADDLGWAAGVNRGIGEAHRNGIVTSTSLLANGSAFADGVALSHATPSLRVGVHLNLSDGAPVAPAGSVKSLLNEAAEFQGGPENLLLRVARKNLVLEEVETEWDTQIAKIRSAGIAPTHLDGHKHVHMLPGLFEIALRLAKRHGIGAVRVSHEASNLRVALSTGAGQRGSVVLKQGVQARGLKLIARDAREMAERAGIATADYFCGIAQTGELTRDGVEQLLKNLPEGTTELMCHPGFMDDSLRNSRTRLQESRESEISILTDPGIRSLITSQGIRLIDYRSIAYEA
jgi:chitin disaccharide deacetylase